MSAMKPCPFCGRPVGITEMFIGTAYRSHGTMCHEVSAKIECPCGLTYEREWTELMRNGWVYKLYPTDEDITTTWNRRVPDANQKPGH